MKSKIAKQFSLSMTSLMIPLALSISVSAAATAAPAEFQIHRGIASSEVVAQNVRLRDVGGRKILEYKNPRVKGEAWTTFGRINSYPAGTALYHWGPAGDVQYWTTKGIHEEEIRKAVTTRNFSDVVGGGFYVSLSATDSKMFGEKLLMALPPEPVLALNFTDIEGEYENQSLQYDRDRQGFRDRKTDVVVPAVLMAEAGIDLIQYRETWLVAISARPLARLVEGDWNAFIAYSQSKGLNLGHFMVMTEKYPLTPEIRSSNGFKKAFPLIAKYLSGEAISDSEYLEVAKETFGQDSSVEILGPTNRARFGAQWKPLLEHVQKELNTYLGI